MTCSKRHSVLSCNTFKCISISFWRCRGKAVPSPGTWRNSPTSRTTCEPSSSTGWSRSHWSTSCTRRLSTWPSTTSIASWATCLSSEQSCNWWGPLPCSSQRKCRYVVVEYQVTEFTVAISYRKYEEVFPPDVGEFVYITDDTYTKRQVTRMEILILRILDFDLSVPTPYCFISALCTSNRFSDEVMYFAMVSAAFYRTCGRFLWTFLLINIRTRGTLYFVGIKLKLLDLHVLSDETHFRLVFLGPNFSTSASCRC